MDLSQREKLLKLVGLPTNSGEIIGMGFSLEYFVEKDTDVRGSLQGLISGVGCCGENNQDNTLGLFSLTNLFIDGCPVHCLYYSENTGKWRIRLTPEPVGLIAWDKWPSKGVIIKTLDFLSN